MVCRHSTCPRVLQHSSVNTALPVLWDCTWTSCLRFYLSICSFGFDCLRVNFPRTSHYQRKINKESPNEGPFSVMCHCVHCTSRHQDTISDTQMACYMLCTLYQRTPRHDFRHANGMLYESCKIQDGLALTTWGLLFPLVVETPVSWHHRKPLVLVVNRLIGQPILHWPGRGVALRIFLTCTPELFRRQLLSGCPSPALFLPAVRGKQWRAIVARHGEEVSSWSATWGCCGRESWWRPWLTAVTPDLFQFLLPGVAICWQSCFLIRITC